MSEFWAIRESKERVLRPFGADSASEFDAIPVGKPLFVSARAPRNGKHHRLFWTMCHRIAEGIGCKREDVAHILKVRTGYCRRVETRKGVEEVPESISWAKMDQLTFNDFFEKCLVVIHEHLGIARPDILELVKDLLEEKVEA